MSLVTTQTLHATSDFLVDRHPFQDTPENFTSIVNPHEVRQAFGRRGVRKLVDVLAFKEATPQELEESLLLLHGQMTTQEKKIEAVGAGAVEACTELLANTVAEVRGNAALLLASLALQLQARWSMGKAGSLQALAPLLADSDPRVARAAASTLAAVTMVEDGGGLVFEAPGVVSAIVDSLKTYPWPVLGLANFVHWYKEFTQAAIEAGAVAAVLALAADPSTPVQPLQRGCAALRSMMAAPLGKEHCVEQQAVAAVAGLLTHTSPDVRCAASGTLPLLAATNLGTFPQFAALGAPGIASVCRGLDDENLRVCHNARLGVLHFAAQPDLKRRLAAHILQNYGSDMYLHVFGAGAAQEVVTGLAMPASAGCRAAAADTAYGMLSIEGGAGALAGALHMVPTLLYAALTASDDGQLLAVRDVEVAAQEAAGFPAEDGSSKPAGAATGAGGEGHTTVDHEDGHDEATAARCCAVLEELCHRFPDAKAALRGAVQGARFDGSEVHADHVRDRLPNLVAGEGHGLLELLEDRPQSPEEE